MESNEMKSMIAAGGALGVLARMLVDKAEERVDAAIRSNRTRTFDRDALVANEVEELCRALSLLAADCVDYPPN